MSLNRRESAFYTICRRPFWEKRCSLTQARQAKGARRVEPRPDHSLDPRLRWLAMMVLVVVGWFRAWSAARLLIVRAPLEHADAIVVLSGSSRLAERNHVAAELFRQRRAPGVILTNDHQLLGWDSTEQRNPFSYERARWILQTDGVPVSRVEVLMQPGRGTYGELDSVREYASQRQLRSLLLVTSAYHARRTLWTARHLFKDTGVVIGLE